MLGIDQRNDCASITSIYNMTDKDSEFSTLELPSFIRGFLKLYFHLRTMKIRRKEVGRLRALEGALNTIKKEYERAKNAGED